MKRENLNLDEPSERKPSYGIRFNKCNWFLLVFVFVAAISTIVTFAVLFVEQNDEIAVLQNILALSNSSSLIPSKPTSTPATTEAPFSSVNATYRLPKSIVPSHYDLFIQVHLPHPDIPGNTSLDFTTQGKVIINFEVTEPTDVIILHAWDLKIETMFLRNKSLSLGIRSITLEPARNFLMVLLYKQLSIGDGYQLEIAYQGLIVSENRGFYRSSYMENGQTRWLAVTQFQPYKARRAFPCFDEPNFRTTFQITLKHRSVFNATSVRKVKRSEYSAGDTEWKETTFDQTQRMPVYLLAFLISDFAREVRLSDRLEFGMISRKELIVNTEFAQSLAIYMLEYFSQKMNLRYEEFNDKLDIGGVPNFSQGMENWGLILYGEGSLSYRRGIQSAEDKKQVGLVIAHEIAHQWFGNPVTCSWWSEVFLNEALAMFFMQVATDYFMPEWKLWDTFTLVETRNGYDLDSYPTSIPMYKPDVETPEQIDEMFGGITYQKGPAIFRMIDHFMGREDFLAALRTYLAEQKVMGSTTYPILLNALTRQMAKTERKENMTQRFEAWFTKSGFPLVTVNRTNQFMFLHQQRFLLGNENDSDATIWNIPITLTTSKTQSGVKTQFWFDMKTMEITYPPNAETKTDLDLDGSWYLVNVGHYGFYRVNYDTTNWRLLMNQLQSNHTVIEISSRVQLIDDSFSLARKGLLAYDIATGLIQYLDRQEEHSPWAVTLQSLSYLSSMIGFETIQPFMAKLLDRVYSSSLWNTTDTWQDVINEDYTTLSLHSNWIEHACFYHVGTCLAEAGKFFREWRDTDQNTRSMDPHLTKHILCYGIRNGDEKDFEFLLDQYEKTEAMSTKLLMLRGMACSKTSRLINRLLEMTINATVIKPQYARNVFQYLAQFPNGIEEAWRFLQKNWSKLTRREAMITAICGNFNSLEHLQQVDSFYKSLGVNVAEKLTFESVLAKIRSNIQWMKTYYIQVVQALTTAISIG